MIAVDTNILVYAFDSQAAEHTAADTAMRRLVGSARWGLPWPVVYEFFRVVTGGVAYEAAASDAALAALDVWIGSPGAILLTQSPTDWPRSRALLESSRASGRVAYDARLAAICLANGVSELWTADRDFGRYPELRTRNPLVS